MAQEEFESHQLYNLAHYVSLAAAAGVNGSKEAGKIITKGLKEFILEPEKMDSEDYSDADLTQIASLYKITVPVLKKKLDSGWKPSLRIK